MAVLGLAVVGVREVEEVLVGNLVAAVELGNLEEEPTARSLVVGVSAVRSTGDTWGGNIVNGSGGVCVGSRMGAGGGKGGKPGGGGRAGKPGGGANGSKPGAGGGGLALVRLVKMVASWSRAARSSARMGARGEAGDGRVKAFVRSRAAAMA